MKKKKVEWITKYKTLAKDVLMTKVGRRCSAN